MKKKKGEENGLAIKYHFKVVCRDCKREMKDSMLILIGKTLKCCYDRNQYFVLVPIPEWIPKDKIPKEVMLP